MIRKPISCFRLQHILRQSQAAKAIPSDIQIRTSTATDSDTQPNNARTPYTPSDNSRSILTLANSYTHQEYISQDSL